MNQRVRRQTLFELDDWRHFGALRTYKGRRTVRKIYEEAEDSACVRTCVRSEDDALQGHRMVFVLEDVYTGRAVDGIRETGELQCQSLLSQVVWRRRRRHLLPS